MAVKRNVVAAGPAEESSEEIVNSAFISAITGSTTEPAIEFETPDGVSRIVRTDIRHGDLIAHRGYRSTLTLSKDDEGVVKVTRIEPEQ